LTGCLRHTVNEFTGELSQTPDAIRVEVASSLIEASRLPNLKWREFAIAKASENTCDKELYLRLQIAAAYSQLKRLQGHISGAEEALLWAQQLDQRKTASSAAGRSGLGQAINQRCLNHLQNDDIAGAIESLKSWVPGPTPMEAAITFHNRLLWARALRYEGQWEAARDRLDELERLQADNLELNCEEHLPEFVYERAALLIEQGDPTQAEARICEQLERMRSKDIKYPSNVSLRLLLAESLFAQKGMLNQALVQCEYLKKDCRKKFDSLHLNIIVAKIYHRLLLSETWTDSEQKFICGEAFRHWTEASKLLMHFQLNEGHSTVVLYKSLNHLFSHCKDPEWQDYETATQRVLENTRWGTKNGTVKNWIPGFCTQWKKEIESWPVDDFVSKL
jgi:tetratricopeptide (TPR) repeat protein